MAAGIAGAKAANVVSLNVVSVNVVSVIAFSWEYASHLSFKAQSTNGVWLSTDVGSNTVARPRRSLTGFPIHERMAR